MKELTAQTFDDFIKEGTAVVDFWAPWCGPCKMMGPEFEKASESKKDVSFAKVNVDEEGELAQRFQVMSIPTTILFKNKEQVDRKSGAMSAADIEKFVSQ